MAEGVDQKITPTPTGVVPVQSCVTAITVAHGREQVLLTADPANNLLTITVGTQRVNFPAASAARPLMNAIAILCQMEVP